METLTFTPDAVGRLLAERPGPCVSLYMPTHRYGIEIQQDPIRLDNLLDRAEERLAERGVEASTVTELLLPARALLDDPLYWTRQDHGLALFLAPGFTEAHRLSVAVDEWVTVGERFAVRPLVPLLTADIRFHVLALSLGAVRLVESTPGGVGRLPLPDVEAGFEATMGYEQFYAGLQVHSSTSRGLGKRPAIFHGHGDSDEEHLEEDVAQFFRRVAEAVKRIRKRPLPLVLAAVEPHLATYRRVSRDAQLLEAAIPGNPDELADEELVARARPLLAEWRRAERDAVLGRYPDERGTGRAADEPEEILPAAAAGRVDTLFVADGAVRWGTYEPDLERLRLHATADPGDEELLERTVYETLKRGGTAHAVDPDQMPGGAVVAALYRW